MLVTRYMPELEQTKVAIALREKEGQFRQKHAPHASDTAQLVTSNLPELSNWGLNGSAPPLAQHAAADLDRLALSVQEEHAPPSNGATAAVRWPSGSQCHCVAVCHEAVIIVMVPTGAAQLGDPQHHAAAAAC